MVERNVKAVDDDEAPITRIELPTIDKVGYVTTKVVSDDEIKDPFAGKIENSSQFTGVSPGFKKSVTAHLQKMRSGADGTSSKQIHEDVFYTGYDMFGVVEPPHNLDALAKLYEVSPHHYAAVNAKVSNIVGLGFMLVESPLTKRNLEDITSKDKLAKMRKKLRAHKEDIIAQIEGFNDELTFTEILMRVWRDYETMGNGYLEIGRKKNGEVGYVGHIPGQTMRIRRERDGFVQVSGFKAQFFANFGKAKETGNPFGTGDVNEIIHISKYSPTSGYYGIPDVLAAQGAVAGNEFANRYNLDYFENKAVPRHVIVLKGAKLGHTAETDLLSFFETSLKGKNHRSLFIPLPGDTDNNKVDIKFEKIEAGTQDSSFTNYRKANLADILMVHRVPITKISTAEGASLAVAKDADKTFKEQVCGPEQKVMEKRLNRIIKGMTDAFEIKLNELTLTDENTQSQIDERRRKTGTETANEQRSARGMPSIEGGDELFDMNGTAKAKSQAEQAGTVNRDRDSQRSANATDSAGAARNPKGEGRTQS